MIGLNTFIMHSNTSDVVRFLDEMLEIDEDGHSPGILLLLGKAKTGKDRIIRYWMRQEHWSDERRRTMELPPIIMADIWKTEYATLGRNVYATPITCRTFSEIAYELGKASPPSAPSYVKRWYREPKSLATDTQFDSLFSLVRAEIRRLRVQVVIINNAHLLDVCALDMLVRLRKHCDNALSIILVAQLPEKADVDEPLADAFGKVEEAEELCRRVELHHLTKKEYQTSVLRALSRELNLEYADDLLKPTIAERVPNALWQHTKADWKLIDRLALDIKHAVPESGNGRRRKLTKKVLERILGKSLDEQPRSRQNPPSITQGAR